MCALAVSVAHTGDAPPDGLAAEVELANGVCSLLMLVLAAMKTAAPPSSPSQQPPPPPPLLRAIAASIALAADWLDVSAAAEGLTQHPDLEAGVGKVRKKGGSGLLVSWGYRFLGVPWNSRYVQAYSGHHPGPLCAALSWTATERQLPYAGV
jgi:hypothetical protein